MQARVEAGLLNLGRPERAGLRTVGPARPQVVLQARQAIRHSAAEHAVLQVFLVGAGGAGAARDPAALGAEQFGQAAAVLDARVAEGQRGIAVAGGIVAAAVHRGLDRGIGMEERSRRIQRPHMQPVGALGREDDRPMPGQACLDARQRARGGAFEVRQGVGVERQAPAGIRRGVIGGRYRRACHDGSPTATGVAGERIPAR